MDLKKKDHHHSGRMRRYTLRFCRSRTSIAETGAH